MKLRHVLPGIRAAIYLLRAMPWAALALASEACLRLLGERPGDLWGDPWLTRGRGQAAQLVNSFRHRRCPTCGVLGDLWKGPRGGMSVNVLCGTCGTRYNMDDAMLLPIEVTTPGPRQVPPEERALFGGPQP